ncbi:mitochondrial import inner membrane translocase subunit [Niveomyces insectorum RCEF 264]|uniref:Mitochondrial import inner membrane translocase subunit n=1 Tax=Niveomyces insectorum RCEF 264 TaxID=1081102 RepID=A0A168A4M4_9HYPO|nr:mitochondrial import inner membrane translocase subunit [Niveomyces insectorum RCEF 264]
MSIWDALTGRKSSHASSSSSTSSPSLDVSASTGDAPSSPSTTSSSSSSSSQHAFLDSSLPSTGYPAMAGTGTGGADAFLQSSAFADPTQLHPLAGLNKETLEYIALEDSALSDLPGSQSVLPSRGFTDDLCYGTGITYLTALSLGGAWGLQEGLRRSAGQPPKLRLNSVLNAVTRRGPFLGNSAGVVAIAYNCTNSYLGYVRGRHDAANSVLAGALSGMLFKSTRGLRPMLISGGIVASVAAAWTVTRRTFFPIPDTHHA